MLDLVNQVRAENGVDPLTWCPALVRSSLAHSRDMAARNYFEHDSPEGDDVGVRAKEQTYEWRAIGENIAFGQRDVNQAMDDWINSPGHFANLIEGAFEHLGSASFMGKLDGQSGLFWTQNFGAAGDCS